MIDYTDDIINGKDRISKRHRLFLNGARTKMGIPTYYQKRDHLAWIRRNWGKWSSMPDALLNKEIDVF